MAHMHDLRFPPLLGVVVLVGLGMAAYVGAERRDADVAVVHAPARVQDKEEQQPQADVPAPLSDLQPAYERALEDGALVPPFLTALDRRLAALPDPTSLAAEAANYSTRLLISRLQAHD